MGLCFVSRSDSNPGKHILVLPVIVIVLGYSIFPLAVRHYKDLGSLYKAILIENPRDKPLPTASTIDPETIDTEEMTNHPLHRFSSFFTTPFNLAQDMDASADAPFRDDKEPSATFQDLPQSLKRHFSSLSANGNEFSDSSTDQPEVRKRQTRSWDWKETHRNDSKMAPRLAMARLSRWVADLCSQIKKPRDAIPAWQLILAIFILFGLIFCQQTSPYASELLSGFSSKTIPRVLCFSPWIKDLPQCAPSSRKNTFPADPLILGQMRMFQDSWVELQRLSSSGPEITNSFSASIDIMGRIHYVVEDSGLPQRKAFVQSYKDVARRAPEVTDAISEYLVKIKASAIVWKSYCARFLEELERIESNPGKTSWIDNWLPTIGLTVGLDDPLRAYSIFLESLLMDVTRFHIKGKKVRMSLSLTKMAMEGMAGFVTTNWETRERQMQGMKDAFLGGFRHASAISALEMTYRPVKEAMGYYEALNDILQRMDSAVENVRYNLLMIKESIKDMPPSNRLHESPQTARMLRALVTEFSACLEGVDMRLNLGSGTVPSDVRRGTLIGKGSKNGIA